MTRRDGDLEWKLYLRGELSWLVGLCKEAGFPHEGMSIMRIRSEVERQGGWGRARCL